ncbi:LptA/OstA family protein [Parvularcula sp. IMCC14364]|uniref:LptA/OstA family protein n=1 Tax=Parvularcula sp. IMCC14364 TaxID=3067902 RepID=UPI002741858C|nr:LptA/OstA family protein [Parvularcula sp. IMCC14364]
MKKILPAIMAMMIAMGINTANGQLNAGSDAPIDITGDQFEAFRDKDYVVWTGDVQVVQGEAILTAPRLTIFGVESGNLQRINAEGGIRYTNGAEAISSRDAVYSADDETVIFTGDVVVVQGEQVLTGGRLVYYTQTGQLNFTSAGADRVRGIFITED